MSHRPSLPHRTVPRPRGGWGRPADYLLAGCLALTGGLLLVGLLPESIAMSMAFAIGFGASAGWRVFEGDPWRAALQGLAVLAWIGRFRVFGLRATGGLEDGVVLALGAAFLLAGVLLVAWFAGVLPGRANR